MGKTCMGIKPSSSLEKKEQNTEICLDDTVTTTPGSNLHHGGYCNNSIGSSNELLRVRGRKRHRKLIKLIMIPLQSDHHSIITILDWILQF
jgi:hypothetical protein